MDQGSEDPKAQKKPSPDSKPTEGTTPAFDVEGEARRPHEGEAHEGEAHEGEAHEGEEALLPEGVEEQFEADENAEALRELGISEEEIRAAFRAGVLARAQARKYLYAWHARGIPSAHSFASLADIKVSQGWGFRPFGNVAWLRETDGRYGFIVWPGDRNTGKPGERAKNLRAKGDDWKMLLQYLAPALPMDGLDQPSKDEDEELEGEAPARPLSNDWPKEFVVILRAREADVIHLELQVLRPNSLSKDGYLSGTRLRILLRDLDVSFEARGEVRADSETTTPTPPAPPSGPELKVDLPRKDEPAAGAPEGEAKDAGGGEKT